MNRISTALLAGAALLVAAPAFAADLPAPVPSAPAPAPAPVVVTPPAPAVFDWSGLYVGANIGYAFGGSDVVGVDPAGAFAGDAGELELNGLFGGVQAGFNWQFGSVVAGIETDFQLASINDSLEATGPAPAVGTITGDLNWFGTVRGRVGVAFDRALVYATGGLAYGNYEVTFDPTGPAAAVSDSQMLVGWTAGAGLEYGITDNISAKLEYLYVDLGADDYELGTGPGAFQTQGSANFHSVRLGVNYRF